MALYTGFTICQPENSWIDHRHWQAEGVVLPPCLIIDPASLPDSPFRDFVVIAFIRGWKSQPYCFHRFCWYVFFLDGELSFFFSNGEMLGRQSAWIFPKIIASTDVLWVGLRSGNCLHIVCPSGNISLYIYFYHTIYFTLYFTGYIAFITIGGHLWCFPKPPLFQVSTKKLSYKIPQKM